MQHKTLIKYVILFALLIWFVYTPIHELFHAIAAWLFGYSVKFDFSHLVFQTFPIGLQEHPPSIWAGFIMIALPYILDLSLLILLLLISLFYRKKIIIYLAIFPFFDVIANFIATILAFLTKTSNDFLLLALISIWLPIGILFLAITLFFIIWRFNKN